MRCKVYLQRSLSERGERRGEERNGETTEVWSLTMQTGAGEQNIQIEITEITELMTKIHLAFYGPLSSQMSQMRAQ